MRLASKDALRCFFILVVAFVSSDSLRSQSAPNAADAAASAAVQSFYDWYIPATEHAGFELALKERASMLSPRLLTALRADVAARAKAADYIVGLDFDPFTNSQDPWPKYVVGRVTRIHGTWQVALHGVASGKRREKPDVIAELIEENGRWQFVNFLYPGGPDLLTILKRLEHDRTSSAPAPPGK